MSPSHAGSDRPVAVVVDDRSQVAEARSRVGRLASATGLDETDAGRVALVVTEAATNLLKHAGGGEILARRVRGAGPGVEVVAVADAPLAMLPKLHVTTPLDWEQLPWLGVAES